MKRDPKIYWQEYVPGGNNSTLWGLRKLTDTCITTDVWRMYGKKSVPQRSARAEPRYLVSTEYNSGGPDNWSPGPQKNDSARKIFFDPIPGRLPQTPHTSICESDQSWYGIDRTDFGSRRKIISACVGDKRSERVFGFPKRLRKSRKTYSRARISNTRRDFFFSSLSPCRGGLRTETPRDPPGGLRYPRFRWRAPAALFGKSRISSWSTGGVSPGPVFVRKNTLSQIFLRFPRYQTFSREDFPLAQKVHGLKLPNFLET